VDAEVLARHYIRDEHYLHGSVDVPRAQFSAAIADTVTDLLAGVEMPGQVRVPPGDLITQDTLAPTDGNAS
jgi:hypothetical protein